jgi:hypothetical protein
MRHSRSNPFQQRVSLSAAWISSQLGGSGEPNSSGWFRCRCPAHGGDSPFTLALKNASGSGRLVLHCHRGCDAGDVHRQIEHLVATGQFDRNRWTPQLSENVKSTDDLTRRDQAARIWHASRPIAGTLGEVYLRDARGIIVASPDSLRLNPRLFRHILESLPDSLRFNPRLFHAQTGIYAPAIVALIRDAAGEPCAIHRTWLAADGSGKANVEPNRMLLAQQDGGAVRLAEVSSAVVVAEGLETALSVMALFGQPAWAALSTGGMRALRLPPSIRFVTIAADHDAPGLAAAQALAGRLEAEGRRVLVIRPKHEGQDFNDVLMAKAANNALRGRVA